MRRLFIVFSLLLTVNVFADSAKVKYMIGEVRVKQVSIQKGWTALTMQTPLQEKDIIRTGTEAYVEIELPDGSVTKMFGSSILELRNFPDPADNSFNLFTGLGKFYFKVKKLLKRQFKVSSPVAVAAIRGTEFLVLNKGDKTDLLVQDGTVDFSDLYMKQTVQVHAGFKSALSAGSLPNRPVALSEKEKQALKKLSTHRPGKTAPKTKPKKAKTKTKPAKTVRPNDAQIPSTSKPVQKPHNKPAPQEEPKTPPVPKNDSGQNGGGSGFNTGVTVGAVTLDGKLYNQIGLRPEFSIGKLGVALDLSFYIDDEGNIRKDNWNSFDDVLEKIYYIRWAHRGDPFYLKVGAIDNYRLGFGILMNHYSNTVEYPNIIRTGVEFGLQTGRFGVDAMLNNVNELLNSGGVMGARFSYNLFGGLQVGASVVFDRNQFKGLKDRDGDDVPDYVDFDPDDKEAMIDSDGDGIADRYDPDRNNDFYFDNPDTAVVPLDVQNDPNRFRTIDPSTLQKPFKISEAENKTQIAFAFDASYPLLTYDYLKLVTYAQYAKYPHNGAWGITAPGFLAKFAFINAYAEYRIFGKHFLPEYFNTTYELERAGFATDSTGAIVPVSKADRLEEINENLKGFVVGADFNLFNYLIFGAEYQDMSRNSLRIRTFRSTLDLNTSFIPKINRAGAYYMQNNARELFKKTEGTIMGYRLEYEISGGASLLLDYRITYRDVDGTGHLEPVKTTNIQTVMRF